MTPDRQRLFRFGAFVLVFQIAATIVAVALDLPAQFGDVGTDAADEFASRGTAISAPLLPLVVLALALVLLRRRDRWATVACVVMAILGVLFTIGSIGEALADTTEDVSRAVLVGSGIVGSVLGVGLVVLGVRAASLHRS
jgi:drug/metabolite transporter (DMT)-like permease